VLAYRLTMVPIRADVLGTWHGSWSPHRIDLTGTCPACGHRTSGIVALRTTSLETESDAVPPALTAALLCQCGAEHPGRAAGTDGGCGRSWAVVATAHEDRSVTLRSAQDPLLVEAAQALREDRAGQLDRLRSAAEKWIPALTALLGLIAVAGLTVGADQVEKLTTGGRIAVAVALAVAVVAGGFAIVGLYRAAYGWPRTSRVDTDELVLDWYRRRQDLPEETGRRLRWAVYAVAVSLAALTLAGGMTWFLPRMR